MNAKLVVHSDPEIMSGTPVFVGARVPVYNLFDYLEAGDPLEKFLGFVALKHGDAEVMLQTVESVRADAASVFEGPVPIRGASLFIEVPNLDEMVAKIPAGTDVFIERRTTFYGATETFLRDAAGNVLVLAQF